MANFAIIGVGGYIAPRHLEAIQEGGHNLVLAYDKNDSVGIMDRFFPDCLFKTEFEVFQSEVDKRKGTPEEIEWVSICSPNYLHAHHARFALRNGMNVICEKPLVLTSSEAEELMAIEKETGKNVYTVLQLRVHESIVALKKKVGEANKSNHQVNLTYMTSRGNWYLESWKGQEKKSGGLSTNIGIHFFDMLTWIFGSATEVEVSEKNELLEKGTLKLEKATVNWLLTLDRTQLPKEAVDSGKTTFRSINIDGEEFEFSSGFTELHKKVYQDVLSGKGYGISDALPAIKIAEQIRRVSLG